MVSQINQDKVHRLIRLIYEAAGEPQQWPAFLQAFGTAVRATAVGLVVIDSRSGRTGVDESVNVDPSYQKLFIQHYGPLNPWTTAEKAHLWTPGSVLEGRDLISDSEMVKTEFYNGFLQPQGWFSALGGAIHRNASSTSYITALRPRSIEPNEGRTLLRTLMPHLQTAVRLHQRICQLDVTLSAMVDALDRLPGGVIIVDANAKALVLNRAAESILAGDNALKNGPDGLFTGEVGESLALQTMIAAAVKARDGAVHAPIPVVISRGSNRQPLQVLVAPVPAQISGTQGQPAAVLFISDPDKIHEPNRTLLQGAFGLTEAEARIASSLAAGKSVEDISVEFEIAPDTVRTHLKKIFSKTDTCRQGDLIRMLLSTWSTLRVDEKPPA